MRRRVLLTYLLAVLAAAVNASSSVLQRKAHRDAPVPNALGPQILHVLRNPVWLLGVGAIIVGFLLQAAALDSGALTVVEPILVIDLPFTLLAGAILFRRKLRPREWTAALAMTAGTAGLIFFLAPSPHPSETAPATAWIIGIPANVAAIAALVVLSLKVAPGRRALLLGIACGTSYGLSVTFMKSVTTAMSQDGFVGVLTAWQTYGMILLGVGAVYLEQAAFNAGSLVAAQPGMTILDPVVSALWGVFAYGESVRTGGWLVGAVIAAVVVAFGVIELGTSPLLSAVSGEDAGDEQPAGDRVTNDVEAVGAR